MRVPTLNTPALTIPALTIPALASWTLGCIDRHARSHRNRTFRPQGCCAVRGVRRARRVGLDKARRGYVLVRPRLTAYVGAWSPTAPVPHDPIPHDPIPHDPAAHDPAHGRPGPGTPAAGQPGSRIRLLSEATVNRIAAGEVIERPAAAVKELVENALDAGATRIVVALDGGGIDRLEVTDNGIGMSEDELALAVLRHATSKLTDESLIRITTLGFRGEALPSIGAAARLSITSRPAPAADAPLAAADAAHAWSVTVEGGAVSAVTPAAGPPGTRVVVRDLFFATPARRKFLKSAAHRGRPCRGDGAPPCARRAACRLPAGNRWPHRVRGPGARACRPRCGAVRPRGRRGAAAGGRGTRRDADQRLCLRAVGDPSLGGGADAGGQWTAGG